jgi:two-component system cell cycle sensor histidine kinase/response regulator CckA
LTPGDRELEDLRAELRMARQTADDLGVFAHLFEALEAPVAVWHVAPGGDRCDLIASNAASASILGERVAGEQDPPTFAGPDLLARLKPLLEATGPVELGEFSSLDGARVYAARGCALEDGLVGVGFFDVTERRALERERRDINLRMQHAQKLESLGVLAGGLPPSSPARALLERAEATARVASELTRQMLAYSGRGRFVIENLDLSTVVEEMTRLLSVSLHAGAALRFDIARDLPPVEMDASQIRQVVMNLVTNASDALQGAGGIISVRTGRLSADEEALTRCWLSDGVTGGEFVFVEVSDSGAGMTKETQARLFDPFFTTTATGRGLGMAAVLGIVRGHKGAIRVYSELGHGTTIRVLLPVAHGLTITTQTTPVVPAQAPRDALVLVVDDEAAVRTIACAVLERAGCRTLGAANGEEALALFSLQPDEIDLVLLDLTMPVMDGEETFHALRALRPDVRVIMTSGYNRQDATARLAGRRLAGFLQKPWTAAALQEAVAAALEGGEDGGLPAR